MTISPETGEIFKTQGLRFATPLTSRPHLASFEDQDVYLGFNSNFDNDPMSKVVKLRQSSSSLTPQESKVFLEATKITAFTTTRLQYIWVALTQPDTDNGGDEDAHLLRLEDF